MRLRCLRSTFSWLFLSSRFGGAPLLRSVRAVRSSSADWGDAPRLSAGGSQSHPLPGRSGKKLQVAGPLSSMRRASGLQA